MSPRLVVNHKMAADATWQFTTTDGDEPCPPRWYSRAATSIRTRLVYGWSNIKREAWSPSGRAFGLAMLLALLALNFAEVDGWHREPDSGWAWAVAMLLAVVSLGCASISGKRETREQILSRYKHDIEAAAVVCNAAGCFLGDPHRSSPAAENAKLLATRLRLLKQELETRSVGTHGGGPQ